MGQYYKGDKIGTCESMYYMRMEEAQELARQGQKDDDGISFEEYLNDGATRFRFPFPSEDGMTNNQLLGIPNHQPSFMVSADGVDVNHRDKCYSNSIDGTHNVNIFIPCLYSEEFKKMGIKTSNSGAGEQKLKVIMQGMRSCNAEDRTKDLQVKTIFACARCDQEQYFSDDDIEQIKARSIEYYAGYDCTGKNPSYSGNQALYDNAMKIISRIS